MAVDPLALPPKYCRSPNQCAQHQQSATHMYELTPALCIVQLAHCSQQINPVMRPISACAPTDQGQLRMQRIVDVGRQIDQADTRQPKSDGRTEIVAVLRDEGDTDPEWQCKLEQAAAKYHHELAKWPEQHMPRFVYRQQDIVHEGCTYLTVTVVISKKKQAPESQQCKSGTSSIKRHCIHLLQRLQQGCDVTMFGING